MEFPQVILTLSLALGIAVVLYSWKNPLNLIPLFILFLGGVFGQVDLGERLYIQLFEGVRLHLRDFVIMIMLVHVIRRPHAFVQRKQTAFGHAISLFLLYLLANLCIKLIFFGAEFDSKISPFIRLFSTFAIYYLIVGYLRSDNFIPFIRSCYVLCIASVLILLGYVLLLIPIPEGFKVGFFPSAEGGSQAVRFGMPNHFFLFFPYFMAIAPLIGYVDKTRPLERLIIILMIVGSALALFRMYLFVVVFGGVAAFVGGRGRVIRKFVVGTAVAIGLFFVVQMISEAKGSEITESFIRRFSTTSDEFANEEGSAGGRVVRTYAAFGQLTEPSVLLLGAAFTREFSEVLDFATSDLGVISTVMYYGLPGLVLIVFIYKRGITVALASVKRKDALGHSAGALLLFLIAVFPGTLFMYNPLESEMFIAVWATFLGAFDALYAESMALNKRDTSAAV